jgi:hypothetical protein
MKIPKSHLVALLIFILIGFAVLSYVSLVVFRDYPFCMDEYNYLYQAKIFASGHLYLKTDSQLSDLFETFMIFKDSKLFSKYPPGCSLLLLLGVKLGIPGLINPLLSVATMLLIYLLGAKLVGRKFSLLALLVIASNIYFLGYGASYFSQPASLFFSSLNLFFYYSYITTKRMPFLCVAAAAICLQTLVRPLDALCLWIILYLDVRRRQTEKTLNPLLVFVILSAIGAALLLVYNKITGGQWAITPYPVWDSDFKLVYRQSGETFTIFGYIAALLNNYLANLKNGFWPILTQHFIPYLVWWLPFIVLGFIGKKQENTGFTRFRRILLGYSLLFVALYNFHPPGLLGWPQYGARYWYPLITVLALFLVTGFRALYDIASRQFFWAVFGLFILCQTLQSVHYLNIYSGRFEYIQSVLADINAKCPPKSIVMLHKPAQWEKMFRSYITWGDIRRNPFLSGDRLYLVTGGNLAAIRSFYPDYSVCNYYFPDYNPDSDSK